MHRDPNRVARPLHLHRHLDILLARRRVARRMVVHQNDRRRVQFQRPLRNLARVDRHMIDRAVGLRLIRDQRVLAIQKQHPKLLRLAVRHDRFAIGHQIIPRRHNIALEHLRPPHPRRKGLCHAQVEIDLLVGPLHLQKPLPRRRNHAVQIAELFQKTLGQGLHINPRNRVEQQQFQHFIFGHRIMPALQKPLPKTLPMAPIMRAALAVLAGQNAATGRVPFRQARGRREAPRKGGLGHHIGRRNARVQIVEAFHRLLRQATGRRPTGRRPTPRHIIPALERIGAAF